MSKEYYQLEVLLELLQAMEPDWTAFDAVLWISKKQAELTRIDQEKELAHFNHDMKQLTTKGKQ